MKSNDPTAVVLAILCDFEGKDKQMVVNTILKRLIKLSDNEVSFRNYLEKVEVFSTNRDLEKYVDKGEAMLAVDIERLPSFNRGLEKGIETTLEKVAIGMLKLNLDIDIIQKTTGLSVEKIERLKRTIKNSN